mgnify:CR=1 FL=1
MLTRFQRVRAKVFLTIIGIIRHMTIGTKVMLIDGNKVFLIKHTLIPGWQFPGGGIEPGETAEASAARETPPKRTTVEKARSRCVGGLRRRKLMTGI